MGTEVTQVMQGRFRTNDDPTVILKIETEGAETRCAGSLFQNFTIRAEKAPLLHRWDLPLNASKSHHLSIGGTHDLCIALSEEAAGKSLQKCEQINDLGITVNAAFTPSAAIKASGILYFIKRLLAA